MFGRFRKSGVGVYRPKERLIYEYFDGQKDVHADPMELWKKVMDCAKDLEIHIQVANSKMAKSEDCAKAESEALAKIREIFGVRPFAEGGLTNLEQSELFDNFMTFCVALKKNSRYSVTFSNSQGSPFPFQKSTTQYPLVSGSIGNEGSTILPERSPSGPE